MPTFVEGSVLANAIYSDCGFNVTFLVSKKANFVFGAISLSSLDGEIFKKYLL